MKNDSAYIEGKPTPGGANENLQVLPMGEIQKEIATGGLGCLDTLDNSIGIDDEGPVRKEVLHIGARLFHISFDIHSKPRCLWNRQTEIEGKASRDAANAYEKAPHRVDVSGF